MATVLPAKSNQSKLHAANERARPEALRLSVAVDIVLFTIHMGALNLLLIRRAADPYQGAWALPGGFVGLDENLEEAAVRELEEETGIRDVYLEQLYTFGCPDRDPRSRVISVAYYALAPLGRCRLHAASDADDARWFGCGRLPSLAFDHRRIVRAAKQRLAAKLEYSTIAFQFMPEQFTLSELQRVHEIILGRPLDKRNFRRRILSLNLLCDTGDSTSKGAARPARLYARREPDRVEIIR